MKRTSFKFFTIAIIAMVFLSSCERVAPNYAGVLMENYGKQGKEDFKVVSGRISTWEWGTELFQVPLFDQRGEFGSPVKTAQAEDTAEAEAPRTISGIVCWGDDLINGEESNTYSYMAVLQKLLTDNGYNLTVINKTLQGGGTLSMMKLEKT